MNWHANLNRLYEEATRSSEACERLLKRLKKTRTIQFITMLGFALVVAASAVWLLIPIHRFLTDPPLPAPAWLDPARYLAMPLVVSFLFVATLQLMGLNHTEACIKMLLLFRAKANATTNEEQTRNA